MRRSYIFALFAFFCIIAIALAQSSVPGAPASKPAATKTDNSAQIKAVESKLEKLNNDLTILSTNMGKIQDENKALLAKLTKLQNAQAVQSTQKVQQDPQVSSLNTSINELRTQFAELGEKVAKLSISSQIQDQVKSLQVFYNASVQPKVAKSCATISLYTEQLLSQARPLFAQQQMHLARFYHYIRAQIDIFKPKIVLLATPVIVQLAFIKPEHRPYATDFCVALAFFFVSFTLFIFVYLIISTILRLICCCGKKNKKQQIIPSNVQSNVKGASKKMN